MDWDGEDILAEADALAAADAAVDRPSDYCGAHPEDWFPQAFARTMWCGASNVLDSTVGEINETIRKGSEDVSGAFEKAADEAGDAVNPWNLAGYGAGLTAGLGVPTLIVVGTVGAVGGDLLLNKGRIIKGVFGGISKLIGMVV